MRVLFVSGTHPAAKHISGVRAGRFAAELAQRGHQCVLLCPARDAGDVAPELASHDWSQPLVWPVALAPRTMPSLGGIGTAAAMLTIGGRQLGLAAGLRTAGEHLLRAFPADALWCTFGMLETVATTRALARRHGRPWLFDVKDNADLYLPAALRRPLARRVRGWGALQSNAVLHADAAARWLGAQPEVVYSGVDDVFFGAEPAEEAADCVTLVGGLYVPAQLARLIAGVAQYNARAARPLRVLHIGAQLEQVRRAAAPHGERVTVTGPGYVAPAEMARLCRGAVANAYVVHGRTFHHKSFELFACRRPVIAFGGDMAETRSVAERLDIALHEPTDAAGMAAALADAAARPITPSPPAGERFFTWTQQAALVERALQGMIRR